MEIVIEIIAQRLVRLAVHRLRACQHEAHIPFAQSLHRANSLTLVCAGIVPKRRAGRAVSISQKIITCSVERVRKMYDLYEKEAESALA